MSVSFFCIFLSEILAPQVLAILVLSNAFKHMLFCLAFLIVLSGSVGLLLQVSLPIHQNHKEIARLGFSEPMLVTQEHLFPSPTTYKYVSYNIIQVTDSFLVRTN